jgi:hypothetical protein
MSKGIDRRLVDEAMDAYIDWREECARVWDAYDRCVQAPAGDAALTFSAYRAALDREECASRAYAQLVTRIVVAKRGARFAGSPSSVPLTLPTPLIAAISVVFGG